jgi:twinkle protein
MTNRTLGPLGVKALEARAIDPEVGARLQLYTGRESNGEVIPDDNGNVICFPFMENGVVVAEKYRAAGKRFWQRVGGKRTFYNADALNDPALEDGSMALTITEGEIDCLSAITCGFPLAVSVPDGAPPPPKEKKEEEGERDDSTGKFEFMYLNRDRLKKIKRFIIAVDNDTNGKHLAEELVRRLSAARCSFVVYPEGCKDLNDVLMKHGHDAAYNVLANAKPYPLKGVYSLSDYPDRAPIQTFSTGWPTIDAHYRPFAPSLTVLLGLPGSGKSTWLMNLCVNLADMHGWKAAIFTPEMPIVPNMRDVMRAIVAGEDVERLTPAQVARADQWINRNFVFIDFDVAGEDERDLTLEWLLDRAYDALMRYGIRVLVLDPWNEIEHAKETRESTTEYTNRALRKLIKFGRRHGIAIYLVVHPTKDVGHGGKTRIPTLYDADGSAAFYNKPDFGIIVDRDPNKHDKTDIYIKKVRFRGTGEKGHVVMKFNRDNSRYELLGGNQYQEVMT